MSVRQCFCIQPVNVGPGFVYLLRSLWLASDMIAAAIWQKWVRTVQRGQRIIIITIIINAPTMNVLFKFIHLICDHVW